MDDEDGFRAPTFFESVFEKQWRDHSEKRIRIKRTKAIDLILSLAKELNIADEDLTQRAKKATREIEDWRTFSDNGWISLISSAHRQRQEERVYQSLRDRGLP